MVKLLTSTSTRHIVFRLFGDEAIPDGIVRAMREASVTCGWMRASGVLAEVELRAYGSDVGGPGAERRITGPVQALTIEGSVGLTDGDVSVGLRAVLARETDRGMETLSGEIVTARVVAVEGVVTVFDDLAMARSLDPDAGVWLFGEGSALAITRDTPVDLSRGGAHPVSAPSLPQDGARGQHQAAAPPPPAPSKPSPAWTEAASVSASASKPLPQGPPRYNVVSPPAPSAVMPQRIARPVVEDTEPDGPFPEVSDVVEHFAFGTCDVIKTDGDRLHLRVHKDGRIKEIALEMLRVTLLTTDGETRRYRLDRRL